MSWRDVGDVAFYVAAGVTVTFALLYLLFAPWWKTVGGRNIMAVMGSVALAFAYFAWAIASKGIPAGFLVIITAWVSGRVLTRAQADRELEAERRISDIWKGNFEQSTELNKQLTAALQPVLEQNEAILRAVEAVQTRQVAQEERERWLRERRDRE